MKNFTSKTVGRCLTQYIRKDYEQIVNSFKVFVIISQFEAIPSSLEEAIYGQRKILKVPNYSIGERLFGANEDGSLEELASIIDSSD